jgi:hypothetical protein
MPSATPDPGALMISRSIAASLLPAAGVQESVILPAPGK